MTRRLAGVVALVLLAGALWAGFGTVTSSQGLSCGSWARPSYTAADRETADALAGSQLASTLGQPGVLAQAIHECDQTRADRRTWTLLLLLAAVLAPVAILFVGAGRDRRPEVSGGVPGVS